MLQKDWYNKGEDVTFPYVQLLGKLGWQTTPQHAGTYLLLLCQCLHVYGLLPCWVPLNLQCLDCKAHHEGVNVGGQGGKLLLRL